MNINKLKEAMPFALKAKIPLMLVGHHGIGKTEGVRQFCEEQGHLLRIVNLGTQEVGDIIGLADFEKDKSGNNVATKFMIPDWAKQIKEFCEANPDKHAVLFFDEINRARRDVLQVVFPILLEGRIHTTVFPKNFYVMGAMNPNTEDYIVTDISDKALMDRFCHIKLKPSTPEWFEYAKSRKFEDAVIMYLKEDPKMLSAELEDFSIERKPSRRSWEAVDRVLKTKAPVNILEELVSGLVGFEAATAFIKSLSATDKPISGKEILADYGKFEKRVKKYSDAKTGGRQDLLMYTKDSLIDEIKGRDKKKGLTPDEAKNFGEFLIDIPKEISFMICQEVYMEEFMRPVIDGNKKLIEILTTAKRGK